MNYSSPVEQKVPRDFDYSVTVERVISKHDLANFIDLPPVIYAGHTGYTPPLRIDRSLLLDPRHSAFWKRARACYWLARRGGKVIGRISAQVDPLTPIGLSAGLGMFGCLDAIDDSAVVGGLVDAAEQWLRDEGCTTMAGPFTLDMNDEPGLLVEGAAEPALTLCAWHPPYLGDHLEKLGFAKLRDLKNWRLDLRSTPPKPTEKSFRLADRIPGLTIRYPTRQSYPRDIQALCDIYNDGWHEHWGFVPLTPTDLSGLDQLMKWFVPRECFKLVELAGKPVAVMLLIPNLFELTEGMGARPGALGWAKLAFRTLTHRFRSGRIIVFGVVKDLQKTVVGSAIAALLIDELIAGQRALKGDWVEAGWILEDNHALNQILERFNFVRNRTFRIYERPIGGA